MSRHILLDWAVSPVQALFRQLCMVFPHDRSFSDNSNSALNSPPFRKKIASFVKQALGVSCAAGCLISLCSLPAWADSRNSKDHAKDSVQFVKKTLGQSWAVVIAIDQYANLSPLSYAVQDAKAVARMLAGQGFSVKSFFNTQATRKALLRELQHNLASRVQSKDRVLIFFAGHIGETGEDPPQGYVMPVDTDPGLLADTAIGMKLLEEISRMLPAKQVLVLMNMCYGGIEGRRMQSPVPMTNTRLRAITQEPARQIMTAGGTGQQALAGRKWNHSVFTHYLLEGIGKGYGDLNGDGIIPVSELFTFLDEHVQSAALTHDHIQRPQLWSVSPEKGEFIFLTEGKAPGSTVATIPKEGTTPTPEAGTLERLAGLFKNLGSPLDIFKAPPVTPKQKSSPQTAGVPKSERENRSVQAQQSPQQRKNTLAEQLAETRRLAAEEEERRLSAEHARQEQEVLLAQQQAALQGEKTRLAAEEQQRQEALAELEEARRLAMEEERRRVAAEQVRQEQEALLAEQQAALQAEKARLAAEEEQRKLVLAELAEAQRLAAEEERRRVAAEQARREQEELLAKEQAAIRAEQVRLAAEEARIKELFARQEERQRAQIAEAQQLAAEEARQQQEKLLAQQQAALQIEQARLAAEDDQRQQALAELAEARRLAAEEERRRVAAEQARREQEALLAQERAALQAQQARLAAEEEQRRQALAELAEAQRLAAEEELRRVAAEEARQKQESLLAQQQAALKAQQAKLEAEEEERRQAFARKEQELQRQLEEARRLAAEAQAQQQRLAAEEEQRNKQLADMEKTRQAQLAEAARVAAEQARLAAEEQRKRELAEQEQARQVQLAEARRVAEEEQRQQELAEQDQTRQLQMAEARRAAEEEQRQQALAEKERIRQIQLAEARRAAEEEQRKKKYAEAQRVAAEQARQAAEEQRKRELAEQEQARQMQLAEARRAAEEEQRQRKLAEQERIRQRQLAEAQRAAAEQERKSAEAQQRQQEAAEARRLADLENERRRAAKEQARLAAEEEQRRKEEIAEARRLAALEEERRRAAAVKARQEQEAAMNAEQARKQQEASLPSKKNGQNTSGGSLQNTHSATSKNHSSEEETHQNEESSLFGFIKNLFNEGSSSSIPEQPGAESSSGITGPSISPSGSLHQAEPTGSAQGESVPEPVLEARLHPQDLSKSFSPSASEEDDEPMVLIPAGEFLMGSAPEQIRNSLQKFKGLPFDAFQAEIPQRPVVLDEFYIDQYEVTYRLYGRFLEDTGRHTPKFWKESPFYHPDHPVIGVTWDDAQAYCTWAGKRLPTEAEWEKAARGPQGLLYPWGNEWDSSRANTASFWAGTPFSSIAAWSEWMENALEGKRAGTVEVGRFAHGASPYGVHDMAGNVSEWVFDWYMPYANEPALVHNPRGADSGTMKVHRGGSWSVSAIFARSTYRARENPENGNQYIGMRCAKSSK